MVSKSSEVMARDNVIKWLEKETWKPRWDAYQEEFLNTLTQHMNMKPKAFTEKIGYEGLDHLVFGATFETFLEKTFTDAPQNPVDEYLQRRGWKETPVGRDYLHGLRSTHFSIYEVGDVEPGAWVRVKDLIRPYSSIQVKEVSGSQHMNVTQFLLVKVMPIQDRMQFSGCIFKLPAITARFKTDTIKRALKRAGVSLDKRKYEQPENMAKANEILSSYTMELLSDGFHNLLGPKRHIVNNEGDTLLFADILFPVVDRDRIIDVLERHEEFHRVEPDEPPFWDWLLLEKPVPKKAPEKAQEIARLKSYGDTMISIRGTLELTDEGLKCSVNSKERSDILVPKLQDLLEEAVQAPRIVFQSVESVKEKNSPKKKKALDITSEEEREILQEVLMHHYQDMLDTPIPMLMDQTPREAVKTEVGQMLVTKWLRYLEIGHKQNDSLMAFDFGWMWEELGLRGVRVR